MRSMSTSTLWLRCRPPPRASPIARRHICQATYRWSSGRDGRRKRESLLDNAEPGAEAPAQSDASTSGSNGSREPARSRRRRRRAAAEEEQGSMPSAAATAEAPTGAAWEDSEWGPAAAGPPQEDTAWGWGEGSWQEAGNDGATREAPEGNGAGGEAWEEELQGRQEARRRRQRGGAAAEYEDGGMDSGYDEFEAGNGDYFDDDEEEEEDEDEEAAARFRDRYRPGLSEPDIALLSPQELDRVLPVVPFSAQASYFTGGAAQAVQRWGASLALTVLLSKAALLAATSLTWPLWWPWAQAATRNYALRKQSAQGGLWRTQILEVQSRGRPRPNFSPAGSDGEDAAPRASRFSTMRTTRVVLGDPGGAQTELVLPHDARYDLVEPGQPAELIVLSTSPTFESFKAVKDVYLPECGLWLSEYPFVDRTEFLELSLEIEREAAAAEQGDSGDGAYGEDDAYVNDFPGASPPPPPPRW